ncbi:MAG: hypothetical protein WCG47_01940 [Dermatophilaceae bacterium]
MPDGHFPEGRQHRTDVVEEGRVGPDDEHSGAREPVPVRVEQPGGPVQAHGGLAGPRRALDAHGRRRIGPHQLVLLGLDGRDDVSHRPDPGAFDLLLQDRAVLRGLGRVLEVLVLVCRELAAVDAEPASAGHSERVGPGGPVERTGQLGPPVDDDRVAAFVAHVPPADVPPVGAFDVAVEVETPEEQR